MDKFFGGHSLGIQVLKHEKGSFDIGGDGNVVYFKISNQTSKKIDIQVEALYKINKGNAQFEKDYWLTGFIVDNTSISSRAFKIAAGIFLDSVSGGLYANYKAGITIRDKTNGFLYDALFILKGTNNWSLLNCDITEQQKIPEKSTHETKLKSSIERLELFEEKLGIKLDNLSVRIDEDFNYINVLGEIFSLTGESLNQDIQLNVNLYNPDGDVIATNGSYFSTDSFMGYDTFDIGFYEDNIALEANKIRIYVKKH